MLKIENLYIYINRIKQQKKVDIYSTINPTLIINPYVTNFPKDFLFENISQQNKTKLFLVNVIKFYIHHFLAFSRYLLIFFYFKVLYKKNYKVTQQDLVLDLFVLVESINKTGKLNDNYFVIFTKLILSVSTIYILGVIWLGTLIGWDKPIFELGVMPFLLAEIFKIALLTILAKKIFKLRKFI